MDDLRRSGLSYADKKGGGESVMISIDLLRQTK